MNPIYNIGIRLYRQAAKLVARKNPKAEKMLRGQADTFKYLRDTVRNGENYIWVHAASLGEFEQGRPLIEKLKREKPESKILLTFFSPSGYEVRKNYPGADAICYLPFDTPENARMFVDIVKPSMAFFVKYEFWGNYLEALRSREIPIYLISAIFRKSQIFFKPWGGMFRNLLRLYADIFVQDENSRDLLAGIGVKNVTVAGDTRFDRVTDILRSASEIPSIASFTEKSRFTMIIGSSWPLDEEVYIPWINSHRDVKTVIAPHEFDSNRLEALRKSFDGGAILLSELEANPSLGDSAQCVLVDCFGKLSAIYRYGDAAYVGGGFGTGIHNINEAAVYGIPVIFGPRHHKFKEASDLIACKGGFSIDNAADFSKTAELLLTDTDYRKNAGRNAGSYISRCIGATEKIYGHIFRHEA